MIPQAYIAGAAALVIAAGAFTGGWRVNGWRLAAQQAKVEDSAQKASAAATEAAVAAIKGIEVKYVTIRQNAETVTREVPVYRDGTCNHDPRMRDAINQALAGPDGGAVGVPVAVRPAP